MIGYNKIQNIIKLRNKKIRVYYVYQNKKREVKESKFQKDNIKK